MRVVTETTNTPGLKYTHLGKDSLGVNFYKEEVDEEYYKRREVLQETIDNTRKDVIERVQYNLPKVITEDTFFNKDVSYDIKVDTKYKNIKVTNESTGEVKVFETSGTPTRVMLNGNILTYDDFIDEVSPLTNYAIDINTEQVIGSRSMEASHAGDSSVDFPSLDIVLPRITPAAVDILPQYTRARYMVNIDGLLYNGQNTFFPLISSQASLSNFNILRANYTNFEGKSPTTINYNDNVYLRMVNTSPIVDLKSSFIDSTVPSTVTTIATNISRNYDPSNSAWGVDYSEGSVMDARMSSISFTDPSENWDLRIGKGGQIYSLKTPALGETVPPQRYDINGTAPWVDEVWQTVSVYDIYPNAKYNHSSGVYLEDPILNEPYYTPRLATEIDVVDKSFYSMNWMQPSGQHGTYTENNLSHVINLTKYKDLGDGVIEVTLGLYNFGTTEVYRYHNMPWGGVRRTALEYNYLANADQNTYTRVTGLFAVNEHGTARLVDIEDTGGWTVFCSQSAGDYGESLGLVFGKVDSINSDTYASSRIRQGYASPLSPQPGETDWRNFMVSTVNRQHNINTGKGIWSRSYFVFGKSRDEVRDKILNRSLVNNTPFEEMDNPESSSSLIGYKLSLVDSVFSIEKSDQPDFYLYEQLINNGVPVFEIIKNDGTKYITWDPYTSGTSKMYDGTVQVINLLGFALRTADATGPYTYNTLDSIFNTYSSYYNASGESLSVRV